MPSVDPNTSEASESSSASMARAVDLVKSYGSGDAKVRALNRIGAGDRYRSGVASLENWGSTIELRPRASPAVNDGPVNGRRCEALA